MDKTHSFFIGAMLFVALIPLSIPLAQSEPLTLFRSGQHSMEWLLVEHEGAKGIRSGKECLSCHEGEERELAANNEDSSTQASYIDADFRFSRSATDLTITLRRKGEKKPFQLTMMLRDGSVSAFKRVGCWASCHSDMNGMEADAGLGKYLGVSRTKMTRTGGGNNIKSTEELAALISQGQYIELWQAKVSADTKVDTAQFQLLDKPVTLDKLSVTSFVNYDNGYWEVTFSHSLAAPGAKISGEGLQLFGIALHQEAKGYRHWVSLPLSFGDNAEAIYRAGP